jgi:hypothetical protein
MARIKRALKVDIVTSILSAPQFGVELVGVGRAGLIEALRMLMRTYIQLVAYKGETYVMPHSFSTQPLKPGKNQPE